MSSEGRTALGRFENGGAGSACVCRSRAASLVVMDYPNFSSSHSALSPRPVRFTLPIHPQSGLLPVEAGLNTVVNVAGRISRPALHSGLARGADRRAERMERGYERSEKVPNGRCGMWFDRSHAWGGRPSDTG